MKKRHILYAVGGALLAFVALPVAFFVLPVAAGVLWIAIAGAAVVAFVGFSLAICGFSLATGAVIAIGGGVLIASVILDPIIDAAISRYSLNAGYGQTLDLARVERIEVNGQGANLRISAKTSAPFTAELESRRHGWGALWRSVWAGDVCAGGTSIRIDGATLKVDVGRSWPRSWWWDWSDWSDCTATLTANLPPRAFVKIDQDASKAVLAGDFSTVEVNSTAGDVAIDGHVDVLSLSGAALRARVVYEKVMNDENIVISGKMLDASLRFMMATPISYRIESTMSYVDSRLPNTPGAKPAIRIRGDMVHVVIE
ncbi:MAG: hypothetical protein V6Z86_01500 [Hyphomicrobiales bacterium]